MKKELREANFANAQSEIAKVIQYLEDAKRLYFLPLQLHEETNSVNRSIKNLESIVKRLTKRIQISQVLAPHE